MRTETKYNKIVNFDEEIKEITVLDDIFTYTQETEYKTGVESVITMKGATGTKFELVSKEEYDERMEEYNVIEYLIDSGIELPEQYKGGGFQELYEEMDNDELESFMFDCSYRELWSYLRGELNLSEEEAYIFNCSGGGRCFNKDFQGNINPELSKIIREIES